MKKILLFLFSCLFIFFSCKKESNLSMKQANELYPLAPGNVWIYVDSFFDIYGEYVGKDTFRLKTIKSFDKNGHVYTPITDQFDDSIFVIRSDDSVVFMLEQPGEALLFTWPMDTSQPYITNSYFGDTLKSVITTAVNMSTNFPSYKTVITYNDGSWPDFKQEELYFSAGKGIIKGRDTWKNYLGQNYISDSYMLISYSFY